MHHLENLDKQAIAITDLEAAQAVREAQKKLFQRIFKSSKLSTDSPHQNIASDLTYLAYFVSIVPNKHKIFRK